MDTAESTRDGALSEGTIGHRRLTLAISAAQLGVVDIDLVNAHIEWNDRVHEMHGIAPGEYSGAYGEWKQYVHPDDRPYTTSIVERMATGGSDLEPIAYRALRPSGEIRYLEGTVAAVRDDDGVMRRVMAILHDRTEVEVARQRVARLMTERERLLRETHHRIKNHLMIVGALVGFAEIDGGVDLSHVRQQIGALQRVHELLHREGEGESMRADELLGPIVDSVGEMARRRGVALRHDIERILLPVSVAVPLGLITNELVTNALKHGFRDGSSGEVDATLSEAPDGRCTLIVANSGAPLPLLPVEEATTLGLQVVNGLVGQIEGVLTVERAPRTAFRVTFRLPAPDQD